MLKFSSENFWILKEFCPPCSLRAVCFPFLSFPAAPSCLLGRMLLRWSGFSWFSLDSKNSDRTPIWIVRLVQSLADRTLQLRPRTPGRPLRRRSPTMTTPRCRWKPSTCPGEWPAKAERSWFVKKQCTKGVLLIWGTAVRPELQLYRDCIVFVIVLATSSNTFPFFWENEPGANDSWSLTKKIEVRERIGFHSKDPSGE